MATKRKKVGKTNWSDIGDLRLPHGKWRLNNAAKWYAARLGLPPQAISFINPDGSAARSNKTLMRLRKDWSSLA